MAIKLKTGKYACVYCRKIYSHPEKADECRESHNLVYFPISVKDANSLLTFIFTGDGMILKDVKFVPLLQGVLRRYQREHQNKGV